jgi:hypothetical protein
MALVWTGWGRAVPKVVPRRGSVVHRELAEKLSSGFGEEQSQVRNSSNIGKGTEVDYDGLFDTRSVMFATHYQVAGAAIRTGRPYQTRVNPSHGAPHDPTGDLTSETNWNRNDWPSHFPLPCPEASTP